MKIEERKTSHPFNDKSEGVAKLNGNLYWQLLLSSLPDLASKIRMTKNYWSPWSLGI